ncbi:MAG: hypothetical protein ACFFDN_00225 [Candidatus Hodarchaeota archaeon]
MFDDMVNRMDSREAMMDNYNDMVQKAQMLRHIMGSKKETKYLSRMEKGLTIFFKTMLIPLIVFSLICFLFLFFTSPSHYKELNEFSTEIAFILIILPVILFSTVVFSIFHKPKKILCLDIIQSNKVQDKSEIHPYTRLSSRDVEFHERTISILNNLTRSTQETQEVQINDFLTVKLRGKRTELYVNNEYFQQCMFLLLNIPKENIQDYDEIDSIDEAVEIKYSRELEVLSSSQKERDFQITPEEEFQAHCSNLQAWYEHNYDTRLLHSNLAFPLLKKLAEVGDPLAKKVFKEEIALRLESGYPNVITFLIEKGYLDILEHEELKSILENPAICQNLGNCATSVFLQLRRKVEKQDRLLRQARNRAKKYKYEYPI